MQGDFVCVDGLQRLTALLKFLDNELAVFDGYCRSDIEGIDLLLRGITVKVSINNLPTKAAVLQWYLELNSGGTVHTQAELDRVRTMLKEINKEV